MRIMGQRTIGSLAGGGTEGGRERGRQGGGEAGGPSGGWEEEWEEPTETEELPSSSTQLEMATLPMQALALIQ